LYPDEWKVNVQTLSGSIANLCAYHSQLKPGETILSLNAKTGGGHFTHGLEDESGNGVNLYGQVWDFKHYGIDENGYVNYDEAQEMALKHRPKLIVCGASTYSRDIDYARF
jgi:glycine hydroxymethyltransferase